MIGLTVMAAAFLTQPSQRALTPNRHLKRLKMHFVETGIDLYCNLARMPPDRRRLSVLVVVRPQILLLAVKLLLLDRMIRARAEAEVVMPHPRLFVVAIHRVDPEAMVKVVAEVFPLQPHLHQVKVIKDQDRHLLDPKW